MRINRVVILSIKAAILVGALHLKAFAWAESELPLQNSISVPTACAAMLVSLRRDSASVKPVDDFIRTLETLRPQLESQESATGGLWRKSGISRVAGFSLSNLDRLNQIEEDLISARGIEGPVVAFREFRGHQIQTFLDLFTDNLATLNGQISRELAIRYPDDRLPIMHLTVQMSILPIIMSHFQNWLSNGDGSEQSLVSATVFGLFAAVLAIGNRFLGPSLTEIRGLNEQIETIRSCLNVEPSCLPTDVSIVSGTMNNTQSSLHRSIYTRDQQNLDLSMLVNAATFSRKTLLEGAGTLLKNMIDRSREIDGHVREALADPRGGIRRMFFDSFFYRDQKTDEWVLLVVYRNKLKKAPSQGDGDLIWAGGVN